jgi:hypothetical protein
MFIASRFRKPQAPAGRNSLLSWLSWAEHPSYLAPLGLGRGLKGAAINIALLRSCGRTRRGLTKRQWVLGRPKHDLQPKAPA